MGTAFFVLLFVVLVNGGCILSFNRAQKALRDLGAAWVRALSTARTQEAEPSGDEPPRPSLRMRLPKLALWLPRGSLTLVRPPARG